jgi:hypothetical protein
MLGAGVLLGDLFQRLRPDVTDPGQGAEVVEIAEEIATPVPGPDAPDAGRGR